MGAAESQYVFIAERGATRIAVDGTLAVEAFKNHAALLFKEQERFENQIVVSACNVTFLKRRSHMETPHADSCVS